MPQPGQANALVKFVTPSELGPSSIVLGDTPPTNGQLLIGNGTNFVPATLTGGANVTITNGPGSVSISASLGAVSVGDDDPTTITKHWQRSDAALIPILVAELQSLRKRLAALEAK